MEIFFRSNKFHFFHISLFLMSLNCLWGAPVNDNFSNRTILSGAAVSGTSTTVDATREPFESNPFATAPETVWWTWTAPAAGTVIIDTTGSAINPEYVAVFTGSSIDQLHLVSATSVDNQGTQTITFPTAGGTVFQISVGTNGSNGFGTVKLNIRLGTSNITSASIVGTPADANDNFTNRTALSGTSVSGVGYNYDATREPFENSQTGYRTLWWTWTAPTNGILNVGSSLSSPDNVLAAFTGDKIDSLIAVGATRNAPYQFSIPVMGGTTYQFSIGAYFDRPGFAVLDLSFSNHPPYFAGEVSLGNGAYYLRLASGNPFGYYSYLSDPHYIYHFDLGYEYWFDANDNRQGIYFYDFLSNTFFYTSPGFPFPYLYDFSLGAVLYYYPSSGHPGRYTNNPRYFYNTKTGQIITK